MSYKVIRKNPSLTILKILSIPLSVPFRLYPYVYICLHTRTHVHLYLYTLPSMSDPGQFSPLDMSLILSLLYFLMIDIVP